MANSTTKATATKQQFKEQIHKCDKYIFLAIRDGVDNRIFRISFNNSGYSYSTNKFSSPTEIIEVDYKNCPYCGNSLYDYETVE